MSLTINDIGSIETETSVLLLGSGFSLESKNLNGKNPPNGRGLREHFIEALRLPTTIQYDIQVLAEEFAENDPALLHREMYNIFRIASVGPNQEKILSEKWLRIYTTNYDDTIEYFRLSNKTPPLSFDVSETVPNKFPRNSVVHLHGSIRLTTPDNLMTALVLGETSYIKQHIETSPWFDQLQRDIRFSSKFFVIGHSMADYHISALLLENPEFSSKTYFIQGKSPDQVFERRTKEFGRTLFCGLDGFASGLSTLPRTAPVADITRLKSFRTLDPNNDKRAVRKPTAPEIFDLLVYGNFNPVRCAEVLPAEDYVISRNAEVTKLVEAIATNRSVVVDSHLGNGKTIFLHIASFALTERGYNCLMFRGTGPDIDQEIALLRKQQKLVIFFESYTAAQDSIGFIQQSLESAKFVIEIRSSIYDVRFHEIYQVIPRPFDRVSINLLSRNDLSALEKLCLNAGLRPPIRTRRPQEIRDILLELFENEKIKQQIKTTLEPIFLSPTKRKVLLLSMLLANHQASTDASFIRAVTGADPFHEFREVQHLAGEIFDTSLNGFRVRSAVFSEFTVNTFVPVSEITTCIVEAVLAAAVRKADRRYRVLMSNLMQYSNLRQTLRKQGNSVEVIVGIYEKLRFDQRINDEPLFWLQYAIAMADEAKYPEALEFIDTAYDRAEERDSFQTFQIDTQALRVLLLSATEVKPGSPIENFEAIISKFDKIDVMLGEESHRAYAIKVLENIPPFIERRGRDLSNSERNIIVFWLSKLSGSLSRLPMEYRARSGSDAIARRLEGAKGSLL